MHIAKRYLSTFILFTAIALLWFIRFDNLNDPYFWDELGVYGSGVQYMVEHVVSLQPKNLPPEVSRGHPLLFYALHAAVIDIFGNSVFVSHIFSLLISSTLLIAVFYLAKEVLPKTLAAFAALILASQNIFLAQSSLVIPEISIALCATLGILFYLRKRFLLSAVVLGIAVLIKESAILIPAFIAFFICFDALFFEKKWRHITKAFYYLIPLVVLLIFLQVQFMQNGWYFFPYHTDIVKADALFLFKEKLKDHAIFIFTEQHRYYFSLSLIPAFIFLLIHRNKKIAFFFYFLVSNIIVFSLAFYMDRYLLYVYPFFIIASLYGIQKVLAFSKPIQYLLVLFFSIYALLSYSDRTFNYDASLAYEDILDVKKEAINWLCNNTKQTSKLTGDFFVLKALHNEHYGYTSKDCCLKLQDDESKAVYMVYFQKKIENGPPIKVFSKNEAAIYIYN